VSQLFDALKRNRRAGPSPEYVERTARADAVLATLGYGKKKRASPSQRAGTLAVCGLGVALVVAWALWPSEAPRARQTTAANRRPAPAVPPRSIPEPAMPAPTPPESAPAPALTQAPPAAALIQPAPTPAPAATRSTELRGAAVPGANAVGRTAFPPAAQSRDPSCRARGRSFRRRSCSGSRSTITAPVISSGRRPITGRCSSVMSSIRRSTTTSGSSIATRGSSTNRSASSSAP
jgi:hypothetical protein